VTRISARFRVALFAKGLLLLAFALVFAALLVKSWERGLAVVAAGVVFFGVPGVFCAWTAALAFLVAAAYSLAYLLSRNPRFDQGAHAAVRLGLLFAALTLVTGSLFARIMWGSFWNWDPRESSYLLLLFLYGAYLFLRAAVDDPERRARIAAAYALFAMVLMPFLVFVAPRVTESLHPQTVINPQGKILMDTPTKTVFFAGLVGFTAIFLWLLRLETRLARAEGR